MRSALAAIAVVVALAAPSTASAIVGGYKAPAGAYPFAVRLVTNGNTPATGAYCGGTLIAPNVVLTAAHCTGPADAPWVPENIYALVGSQALDSAERVNVITIIRHPKWSYATFHYDAAILILEHSVTAPTLQLATSTIPAGSGVNAAGWGATRDWGPYAMNLRSVNLKLRTRTACAKGNPASTGIPFWSVSELCASGPYRGSCEGDSGSPLVGIVNGQAALVGLTSIGYGCGDSTHPIVYTRITAIRAWAMSVLASA